MIRNGSMMSLSVAAVLTNMFFATATAVLAVPEATPNPDISPSERALAVQDYRRTCASQISAWQASWKAAGYSVDNVSERIDTEYTDLIIMHPNITALRKARSDYSQRIPSSLGERDMVDICALNVAIRRGASAPPPVQAQRPVRPSIDGQWVASNVTNPLGQGPVNPTPQLTITSKPGGISVISNVDHLNGFYPLYYEWPTAGKYGSSHFIYFDENAPDYIEVWPGTGYSGMFLRASPQRSTAPGVVSRPRTVAPPGRVPTQTPANRKDAFFDRASSLIRDGKIEAALPLLEEGVRMGDPRAQYVLAIILANDGPVPQDLPRALTLMRLAAAQNLPQAVAKLPQMEQLAARGPARNDGSVANPPPNQSATAGMIPEVARAYNNTTDPAIRARIVRNAAQYAKSRPSLVVRANVGSNCIRADMINYEFEAKREIWWAETRFKNTCRTDQIVFVEDQMRNAGNAGMPVTNVGRFFGTWDRRRDPNVGFKPYNLDGDIPRYRISAGAELTAGQGFYYHDPNNLLELWIGSCPARSPANIAQVAFRPAANLRDDPRIACVQGIQGAKEF